MKRTDDRYWQRLRRDKRSAAACLLTILAWLVVLIGVGLLVAPGTQAEARGQALYWAVMIPLGWWATSLVNYEPRAVRLLIPAQIAAPLVGVAGALAAPGLGEAPGPFWIAAAVSLASAATGFALYRGSMLEREGPAR